jgi:hypothetical protein
MCPLRYTRLQLRPSVIHLDFLRICADHLDRILDLVWDSLVQDCAICDVKSRRVKWMAIRLDEVEDNSGDLLFERHATLAIRIHRLRSRAVQARVRLGARWKLCLKLKESLLRPTRIGIFDAKLHSAASLLFGDFGLSG